MGSWDWDLVDGDCVWDDGQCRIFGVDPASFAVDARERQGADPSRGLATAAARACEQLLSDAPVAPDRVPRPPAERRDALVPRHGGARPSTRPARSSRISGVTIDITERKEAEERQALLAREVDHRAKNALAIVQSIVRLTARRQHRGLRRRGRRPHQGAVARAHAAVAVALARRRSRRAGRRGARALPQRATPIAIAVDGPGVLLQPATAQTLALALHELATNAAKYGALSSIVGPARAELGARAGHAGAATGRRPGGPPWRSRPRTGFGTTDHQSPASSGSSAARSSSIGGRRGLRCILIDPARREDRRSPALAMRAQALDAKARRSRHDRVAVAGNRVLLVEDEALVAMVMKRRADRARLRGASARSASVADAIAAVKNNEHRRRPSSTSISAASWSIRSPTR